MLALTSVADGGRSSWFLSELQAAEHAALCSADDPQCCCQQFCHPITADQTNWYVYVSINEVWWNEKQYNFFLSSHHLQQAVSDLLLWSWHEIILVQTALDVNSPGDASHRNNQSQKRHQHRRVHVGEQQRRWKASWDAGRWSHLSFSRASRELTAPVQVWGGPLWIVSCGGDILTRSNICLPASGQKPPRDRKNDANIQREMGHKVKEETSTYIRSYLVHLGGSVH